MLMAAATENGSPTKGPTPLSIPNSLRIQAIVNIFAEFQEIPLIPRMAASGNFNVIDTDIADQRSLLSLYHSIQRIMGEFAPKIDAAEKAEIQMENQRKIDEQTDVLKEDLHAAGVYKNSITKSNRPQDAQHQLRTRNEAWFSDIRPENSKYIEPLSEPLSEALEKGYGFSSAEVQCFLSNIQKYGIPVWGELFALVLEAVGWAALPSPLPETPLQCIQAAFQQQVIDLPFLKALFLKALFCNRFALALCCAKILQQNGCKILVESGIPETFLFHVSTSYVRTAFDILNKTVTMTTPPTEYDSSNVLSIRQRDFFAPPNFPECTYKDAYHALITKNSLPNPLFPNMESEYFRCVTDHRLSRYKK